MKKTFKITSRIDAVTGISARYQAATRRAAVISSLSLTLAGGRLPEFWRQLFRQLAAPYEPPTVERVRVCR